MSLEALVAEARIVLDEDGHLTPDQFKSKYGRCPVGFHTDPATKRCARISDLSRPSFRTKPPAASGSSPVSKPKAASASPVSPDNHGGEHGFVRRALHGVWHALSDPFKKGWKLLTDTKYRTEVKDFVVRAAKKEGSQTKKMAQTFAKVLKGEKVSREEKLAAIEQMADIVKVAALGGMVSHVAAGGLAKLIATLASPADEIVGIAIDKPLRAVTKKIFGRAHGILPTAFYEEGVRAPMTALLGEAYKEGDEYKLIETMVDAILAEAGKSDLKDDDIMRALMKTGLGSKKKGLINKIVGIFSKKEHIDLAALRELI